MKDDLSKAPLFAAMGAVPSVMRPVRARLLRAIGHADPPGMVVSPWIDSVVWLETPTESMMESTDFTLPADPRNSSAPLAPSSLASDGAPPAPAGTTREYPEIAEPCASNPASVPSSSANNASSGPSFKSMMIGLSNPRGMLTGGTSPADSGWMMRGQLTSGRALDLSRYVYASSNTAISSVPSPSTSPRTGADGLAARRRSLSTFTAADVADGISITYTVPDGVVITASSLPSPSMSPTAGADGSALNVDALPIPIVCTTGATAGGTPLKAAGTQVKLMRDAVVSTDAAAMPITVVAPSLIRNSARGARRW